MKIGKLKQRCGKCQLTGYCGSILSDGCLCSRPALAEMDEQEYIRRAKYVKEKMGNEYRVQRGRKLLGMDKARRSIIMQNYDLRKERTMKCNQCRKSSTCLDTSCCWLARCDHLGTASSVRACFGCAGDVAGECDDQDAPVWDCDLGQSNQYCIHHVD